MAVYSSADCDYPVWCIYMHILLSVRGLRPRLMFFVLYSFLLSIPILCYYGIWDELGIELSILEPCLDDQSCILAKPTFHVCTFPLSWKALRPENEGYRD